MRLNELRALPIISALCAVQAIAIRGDALRPAVTAQFFYGKHTRSRPLHHHSYQYEDDSEEDDYKPLDTSTSDDEGQPNSTVRHSSEQRTSYDSDEDDHDNRSRNDFLIHRAGKRTKNEQRFVWHPFTPSFLINYEPYAPINPFVMSKWSRKPNDILLVVLQKQQPPPASSTASCTCESRNETSTKTSDSDDLRKERNESSSPASVDEPHPTATADGPSSCIWAIVACCAPNNYHFRYGCFAYLGCSIAFWDAEPCQLPIMLEAARQAHSYYNQFVYVKVEQPHPDAENFPNTVEDADQNGKNVTTQTTPSTASPTTTSTTTTTTTTTTTVAPTTTPPVATINEQPTTM